MLRGELTEMYKIMRGINKVKIDLFSQDRGLKNQSTYA